MRITVIFLMVLTIVFSKEAYAQSTGPIFSPLKVVYTYMTNNGNIYIQFNPDAMPGCYNDLGGYLVKTHPNFDQLYAQILMMISLQGIKGQVIYNINNVDPEYNGWGKCDIIGISLRP